MIANLHVVAVGARSPVGLRAEPSAAAIRAGISRLAEHPSFTDPSGENIRCARDARLKVAMPATARMFFLAEQAIREAIDKLGPDVALAQEIPVWLALPEDRPGFSSRQAENIRAGLGALGIPRVGAAIRLAGRGHAGAIEALRAGAASAGDGHGDIFIAGGVDSYLDTGTLSWLLANRRLAWRGARGGFPPGESAAMMVVASDSARRRLRLPSLGRVRQVICTHERRSLVSEEGLFGEGLSEAVLRATSDLALPSEVVTDVYGDLNGERHRSEDWGFTLTRTSERMRDGTQYVTSVGSVGDIGAATAALGSVLAIQAWRRNYAAGRLALVWGGSWGGLRGALLLERQVT